MSTGLITGVMEGAVANAASGAMSQGGGGGQQGVKPGSSYGGDFGSGAQAPLMPYSTGQAPAQAGAPTAGAQQPMNNNIVSQLLQSFMTGQEQPQNPAAVPPPPTTSPSMPTNGIGWFGSGMFR